jgi:hypothetical protein
MSLSFEQLLVAALVCGCSFSRPEQGTGKSRTHALTQARTHARTRHVATPPAAHSNLILQQRRRAGGCRSTATCNEAPEGKREATVRRERVRMDTKTTDKARLARHLHHIRHPGDDADEKEGPWLSAKGRTWRAAVARSPHWFVDFRRRTSPTEHRPSG